jgi:hypothetical protein
VAVACLAAKPAGITAVFVQFLKTTTLRPGGE